MTTIDDLLSAGAFAKWALQKSDKFDDYMKALGVGMATRTIANKLSPSVTLSAADNKITILTESTFKTSKLEYPVGVDHVIPETSDGRKNVKSKTVIEGGNKIIRTEAGKNKAGEEIEDFNIETREFKDKTKMTLTLVCKAGAEPVTCVREYTKVE